MAQDVSDNENVDIRLREDEEMDFFTELALHEVERWIQVSLTAFPAVLCYFDT